MIISGQSNGLIEAVELKDHPWFVGVQFHPEFTSHLETPNPIILEFVKQAVKNKVMSKITKNRLFELLSARHLNNPYSKLADITFS
jgi:anthranilate/para-aminobenzoate synthase component II